MNANDKLISDLAWHVQCVGFRLNGYENDNPWHKPVYHVWYDAEERAFHQWTEGSVGGHPAHAVPVTGQHACREKAERVARIIASNGGAK